jgi:hypothetical protein
MAAHLRGHANSQPSVKRKRARFLSHIDRVKSSADRITPRIARDRGRWYKVRAAAQVTSIRPGGHGVASRGLPIRIRIGEGCDSHPHTDMHSIAVVDIDRET